VKILDATAGFKGIWYQKNHPFVTFMDIRKGWINTKTKNAKFRDCGHFKINPDVVSEWKDAPFPDNYFDMIVFDPPHLVFKNKNKKLSAMEKKYGYFYEDNWKQILKEGIKRLFQILKPEGIFVLKWCESSKKTDEVIKLIPYQPLFGSRTGQKHNNFWIVFLKYDVNNKLEVN